MEIRALTDADTDAVLALNEEAVGAVTPMDAAALAWFRSITEHALVCEVDDAVAAFAIAYEPGTPYDSLNYLWHAERFADFLYLDRITVGSAFRRRGIAGSLYDAMEAAAAKHGRMVCEIYTDNEVSLAFHTGRGYREVGHRMPDDGHEVVMMEKPL